MKSDGDKQETETMSYFLLIVGFQYLFLLSSVLNVETRTLSHGFM